MQSLSLSLIRTRTTRTPPPHVAQSHRSGAASQPVPRVVQPPDGRGALLGTGAAEPARGFWLHGALCPVKSASSPVMEEQRRGPGPEAGQLQKDRESGSLSRG